MAYFIQPEYYATEDLQKLRKIIQENGFAVVVLLLVYLHSSAGLNRHISDSSVRDKKFHMPSHSVSLLRDGTYTVND